MIPDDAMLAAYVDGELDAAAAARVEQAIAADPALAGRVAAQRALGDRLAAAFAPVAAAPVPENLRMMLASNAVETSNVVPLKPRARPVRRYWMEAGAIAASLLIGLVVGQQWQAQFQTGPVMGAGDRMIASGTLARALDTQLADNMGGTTRMLASFRDGSGHVCRVFAAPAADGIACHEDGDWTLRRTQTPGVTARTQYRQAGSAQAELMATAQEMMAGDPLDPAGERAARAKGWK